MRTVLVTGGAGFIGSAFVRALHSRDPEASIVVLDVLRYSGDLSLIPDEIKSSDRFEFWHGSVNDVDLVSELVSRASVVVHCAAETHVARSLYSNREYFETDVLGTQSVANAVLRWADSVKVFLHVSSSEVYGSAVYEPMDEDHPLNPANPFAASKMGADRLVSSYVASFDLPAVIVRPFNVYGPGQHLEKLISRFFVSALLEQPLTIHGDGGAVRDWIAVDDVVAAMMLLIDEGAADLRGEVFNLGTGIGTDIRELATMISRLVQEGEPWLEFMDARPGPMIRHVASTEKANTVLGFKAEVPLEEGLSATLGWYKEHTDWWERLISQRKVPIKLRDGSVMWY